MSEAWWIPFYDELLAEALLRRKTAADVAETTAFLWARLELAPGRRVLDQCCGLGQLALALAERGAAASGVDLARGYLEEARRAATERGLAVPFVEADAFAYVSAPPVDAVFNWWTGYGYAPTDAENARMLQAAHDSLAPGGLYALDVPNFAGVLRGFRAHQVDRVPRAEGELLMIRESSIDVTRGVLHKRWTYVLPGGARRTHDSTVRVYLPHQLRELLEAVGFEDVALLGSLGGEPVGLDSPRLIAVARKKGGGR